MRFVGIDPSTKTGFVALGEGSIVLKQKELTGVGSEDPKRMVSLTDDVIAHIRSDDFICIEGFSYNSDGRGLDFQYGFGWSVRNSLFRRGIKYVDVPPSLLKKFVGVTGWAGEPGKKKPLKGKEKKTAVIKATEEHFGFTHTSDNVVDAYVLAQIAFYLTAYKTNQPIFTQSYQDEVLQKILNPEGKKAK